MYIAVFNSNICYSLLLYLVIWLLLLDYQSGILLFFLLDSPILFVNALARHTCNFHKIQYIYLEHWTLSGNCVCLLNVYYLSKYISTSFWSCYYSESCFCFICCYFSWYYSSCNYYLFSFWTCCYFWRDWF